MEEQNEDVSKNSIKPEFGADNNFATKSAPGLRRNFLKFMFSLGGLIVFIFLVTAVSYWQQQNGVRIPGINDKGDIALSSKVSIAAVGENAFGALSNLSAGSSNGSRDSSESLSVSDENTAVTTGKMVAPAAILGQGGGGISSGSSDGVAVDMIYPYEPTYYTYVYKGEEFTQNEAKMNVLKRTAGVSAVSASTLARALDFNLFDLGKLDSAKTSNLSFFEDKEFGYRTDIDLSRGAASIYKNYERWPNNYYSDCKGDLCTNSTSSVSLTPSDLPGDEEIINATRAFLNDYKVDLSAYGTPEINKSFLRYAASQQQVYIPEEVSVIYPLIVDGKSVYESYGEINGLNVNYDVRNKKVSSMYNLTTHNYQASAYEAETDVAKILEVAGNMNGSVPMPVRYDEGDVTYKTVEIELDTPFLGFEIMWRYEDNQSSEYLAPCLIFPIKNSEEITMYGGKRVIVPLIRDFLDQSYGGPIRIMKEGGIGTESSAVNATKPDSSTIKEE
ncbi:MAG: hypothetical protein WC180_01980 [Candidatus Paceibacterota bacterium]